MAAPVDFSQLRVFTFCREVRRSESFDLVGLHDQRFSSKFPVKFEEELVLVALFEAPPGVPLHIQIQVEINKDGQRENVLAAEAEADPDGILVSVIPFDFFEFKKPGAYRFAIYVSGMLVGTTLLNVDQAPLLTSGGGSAIH